MVHLYLRVYLQLKLYYPSVPLSRIMYVKGMDEHPPKNVLYN